MKTDTYKYIVNVEEGKDATMRLYGRIGDAYNEKGELLKKGIDANAFANEMRFCAEVLNCKNINMRISSEGGSVLDGYVILDAMNEINDAGKCNVNTHNAGMAASMASVLLCNGVHRTANDYSTTMIHNANGTSDNKLLNAVNDSIQTIYKNKTRLNGDVANELMNKETYMKASEACEVYGFVDEVINTGKKVKLPKNKSIDALALIYNELITPKTMSKVNALLGLKNEASEDAAVESIESLQEKLKTSEAENTTKDAKIAALEKTVNDAKLAEDAKKENEAKEVVANAIKAGKAKKEDEVKLVALAMVDLYTVKNMLDVQGSTYTAANIQNAANVNLEDASERAKWTIIDWQKKDSKGLENIQKTTPEVYNVMYDNYYKLGIGNKNFKNK